jgi:hypothetical protein
MASDRITDELEMIWKKTVVVKSRHYPGICLERMREVTKPLTHN